MYELEILDERDNDLRDLFAKQDEWMHGDREFYKTIQYLKRSRMTPVQQVLRVLPLSVIQLLIREKSLSAYCNNVRRSHPRVISADVLAIISLPSYPNLAMNAAEFHSAPEGAEYWKDIECKLITIRNSYR